MDWVRLGIAFKASRKDKGLTQPEAGALIGVSKGPIQTIDRGVPHSRVTGTMRAYARLLDWTEGSIERVLAGGDPIVHAGPEGPVGVGESAEVAEATYVARDFALPLRIRKELDDDGELLDTAVITLPGGGRALVIVKSKEGASAEEIEEDLKAWRDEAEPHLKDLSAPTDD